MMKVLITGSNGQLGRSLRHKKPSNIELIALTRHDLDLSSEKSINESIKLHQPEWVINAGAYTHTSIAIHDALKGCGLPISEVHLSNIFQREDFRHVSYVAKLSEGMICGFGSQGYEFALHATVKYI